MFPDFEVICTGASSFHRLKPSICHSPGKSISFCQKKDVCFEKKTVIGYMMFYLQMLGEESSDPRIINPEELNPLRRSGSQRYSLTH